MIDSNLSNSLQESQNKEQLKSLPNTNSTNYTARSNSKGGRPSSLPVGNMGVSTVASNGSDPNEGTVASNYIFDNTYGRG